MYIVNDINHLLTLLRVLKVHELLPAGSLGVSRLKIQQYNGVTMQQLSRYKQVTRLNIDDLELFENWRRGKSRHLSPEDVSTIYIAFKDKQQTVLLSDEDIFLPDLCEQYGVRYKQWEEVISEIADERMIEMYKLLKKAS